MKKVFYSIAVISAMTFASCGGDRGTTTEVADSNQDENVNPTQIKGYGDDRTAVADMGTEAEWRQSSEQAASQMATDLQLSPEAQERVQHTLFERQRRLAELEDRYNYSETSRMGGQANNDTENDMNENQATDMDASRSNNQGNAYEADNNNLQMSETDMNSERELIRTDTDRELKAILTPEQFRMYEQNRANYDEMKYKNDATDTKLKVEEGETKYKSGDTKIKSEEDELKIKTEHEKIKVEKKDN